jgi:hypothetical protein
MNDAFARASAARKTAARLPADAGFPPGIVHARPASRLLRPSRQSTGAPMGGAVIQSSKLRPAQSALVRPSASAAIPPLNSTAGVSVAGLRPSQVGSLGEGDGAARLRIQRCGIGSSCDCPTRDKLAGIEHDLRRGTAADGTPPSAARGARTLIHQALSEPGHPLDRTTAADMQMRFGHNFAQVRVHTGRRASESARSISALAYTVGEDIVFGAGGYAPSAESGRHLLAHELAHVVQQRAGLAETRHSGDGLSMSESSGSSERDADKTARLVVGAATARRRPLPLASGRGIAPTPRSSAGASPYIQRKIQIGATELDTKTVAKLAADLVAGPLRGLAGGPHLVREAVAEMQADPDLLTFADMDAVASNVRDRVLVSHYMRASQGSTRLFKAFSYPDRAGDGTKGTPAKVNDDAKSLWGPVQDWPGDYYFDLSPAGKANPYQALVKLFIEHHTPRKRTLIHCDYLVSVIEFRAYAENLGPARFNALVSTGAIAMRLKYDGFMDLMRSPLPTPGGPPVPPERVPPLKQVTLTSKNELILGDHVTFFNDESYDVLTSVKHDVWRLENAIVIDRVGGQFRYQGHGYFQPVTEAHLLDGMLFHYNRNVKAALAIARRAEHHGPAGTAARAELARDYPNVHEITPGHWVIAGPSELCDGRPVQRDLKYLPRAEAPALKDPCDGMIRVNRPIEAKP